MVVSQTETVSNIDLDIRLHIFLRKSLIKSYLDDDPVSKWVQSSDSMIADVEK